MCVLCVCVLCVCVLCVCVVCVCCVCVLCVCCVCVLCCVCCVCVLCVCVVCVLCVCVCCVVCVLCFADACASYVRYSYMAEQQNTHILFEPRTVSMIIRGAFGTPLTQHHRRQHCLQHASQAYLSSFKINACAQLATDYYKCNAQLFYFQDFALAQ